MLKKTLLSLPITIFALCSTFALHATDDINQNDGQVICERDDQGKNYNIVCKKIPGKSDKPIQEKSVSCSPKGDGIECEDNN